MFQLHISIQQSGERLLYRSPLFVLILSAVYPFAAGWISDIPAVSGSPQSWPSWKTPVSVSGSKQNRYTSTTCIDLAFPDSMGNVFAPVSSCCADLGEFLWVTAHRTPTLQCLSTFFCGRFSVKLCRKADSFAADITFFRSHFHGILRGDAGLIQQLRKAVQNQLCTPLGQQVWPPFCRARCGLQCRCKPLGYTPCNRCAVTSIPVWSSFSDRRDFSGFSIAVAKT